jgi:hypothetical protein
MSITVDYPGGGDDVYGNGSFKVWGTHSAPFTMVTRAKVEWSGGNFVIKGTEGPFGDATFSFTFTNIPKGAVTLTVYGLAGALPATEQPGDPVNFTVRDHRARRRREKEAPREEDEPRAAER